MTKTELHCNFCGKSQYAVAKLIAGPGVFVCNECVDLCTSILREEGIATTGDLAERADQAKLLIAEMLTALQRNKII